MNATMCSNKWLVALLYAVVLFVLFWNLGGSDIWTPNEGFYADAVREMHESGNYLDIYYNYEPRLKKPPMTYWISALSVEILGVNEFSVRLPTALCGLGVVLLTLLLGRLIHDTRTGLIAGLMMAFSFQFIGNTRYATPEVPLTFFFTLTVFLFMLGYKREKVWILYLSYVCLGLTALTKGLHYIVLIAVIAALFFWFDADRKLGGWWRRIKRSHLLPGLVPAFVIGSSWYIYAYIWLEEFFVGVQKHETADRAFGWQLSDLADVTGLFNDHLFFYISVALWGFLPYSLTFFYGLITSLTRRSLLKANAFVFCWLAVMYVALTLMHGKLCTYLIQGHPAMAILAAYFVVHYTPGKPFLKKLFNTTLFFPAVLSFLIAVVAPIYVGLSFWWLLVPVGVAVVAWRFREAWALPVLTMGGVLILLAAAFLPVIEKYRPYDTMQEVIRAEKVDPSLPLLIEMRHLHNLCFYAERRTERDQTPDDLLAAFDAGPAFALVTEETSEALIAAGARVLWEGLLYWDKSEAKFGILVKCVFEAEKGDMEAFSTYRLVYKEG